MEVIIVESKNFKIEENKTIPINKKDILFPTNDNIIFDEEITLLGENIKDIYAENKIRLIIHKDIELIDVFFASFQKQGGLCYNSLGLSPEEYFEFKDINDFVKKVLIEGKYSDYGIAIATGVKSKDAYNLLKEDDEYFLDI